MKAERCGRFTSDDDAYIITCNGYEADQIATAIDAAARRHRIQSRTVKSPYAIRTHTATAESLNQYSIAIRSAS